MTVHSRRYGRWCREHFDTEPESGRPAAQAVEVAVEDTGAPAEQAEGAGEVPPGNPGSLN
ncbi:hypothetical protein BS329_33160 [Amycolatopsis coloradensis]|uniref:Uncharacterized protein n=1 Tax=Amycolatopsis coloradensis TaxID=76021 RepID=A0A1R0KHQ9_9PSEU|nr:hypothetical protein [Amycolatopsis coloradensis]OLZ45292.1 hypothetical protein BS329_33160 [Amycolatopsis coloradensis]